MSKRGHDATAHRAATQAGVLLLAPAENRRSALRDLALDCLERGS
jgi:hypothetical protein